MIGLQGTRPVAVRLLPVVLVPMLLLGACGTKADPKPAAAPRPTGPALANEKVGAACSWLDGAKRRPAGGKDAKTGEAMLIHAKTLAIQASEVDKRWQPFTNDFERIGQADGLPPLKRVNAVCKTWQKDKTFYATHAPPTT